MARKVPFKESVKPQEKREYFNSKYSFKNVTGMKKIGDEAYIVLLKPEEFIFQVEYHKVKEKIHGRLGFKGNYDTNIICKRFDAGGNRLEEVPLCCHYADVLFKEAKEKARQEAISKGLDPEVKANLKINAPMGFSNNPMMYIPIIVLGNTETEAGAKPQLSKLAIKNGRGFFSYLEMNKKAYLSEIYDQLRTDLVNAGDIDEGVQPEELQEIILRELKNRIIKVTASTPQGSVPYEKKYSFVPFTNKNIGKLSGELEAIKNFEEDEELMDRANDFLSLFEIEVDNFVKNWTDEELTRYLVDDEQRRENIRQSEDIKEEVAEVEEITLREETVREVENTAPISQVSKIELTEEDTSFDTSEDDFVDWDDN